MIVIGIKTIGFKVVILVSTRLLLLSEACQVKLKVLKSFHFIIIGIIVINYHRSIFKHKTNLSCVLFLLNKNLKTNNIIGEYFNLKCIYFLNI